jgi:hypothetical protein
LPASTIFLNDLRLYGVSLAPIQFSDCPVSDEMPPAIPDRREMLSIAAWSLKMRWWVSADAAK